VSASHDAKWVGTKGQKRSNSDLSKRDYWRAHAWKTGWEEPYGRAPTENDLMVPTLMEDRTLDHRHRSHVYKEHLADLQALCMRHRRQHDLRRTFITLCRAGGSQDSILKWVSHGPQRSSIIVKYTSPPWASLCTAVK